MDIRDNDTNQNIISLSGAKSERDRDDESQSQARTTEEAKRYRVLFPVRDSSHLTGIMPAANEPEESDDDAVRTRRAIKRVDTRSAFPFEVLRGGRYGEQDGQDTVGHHTGAMEPASMTAYTYKHDHHDDKGGLKRLGEYLSKLGIVKPDAEKRHFHVIKGGKSTHLNNETRRRPSPVHTDMEDEQSYDTNTQNYHWSPEPPNMRPDPYQSYQMINPLSVVVVDENPAVLLSITSTLQSCGYAVRAFKNAYDALLAIKDDPCNVLIATSRMKMMSGATLVEFARTSGDALHALLLTDRWDNSVLNSMRKDRIDGFLIKPLSKSELLDKLNAIIDEA